MVLMTLGAAYGEGRTILKFQPMVYGQPLRLEEGTPARDSIRVQLLRFYISQLSLFSKGETVWTDSRPGYLLDAEHSSTMLLELKAPANIRFDALRFMIGIDSATNAAGIGSGDLDPAKGMYWAWQSGYINMKLEGTSPVCKTRKNLFQFHLGGFLNGDEAAQWITLPAGEGNQHTVEIDISQFLSQLDLATQNTVMIPGREAVDLSKKMTQAFRVRSAQ